MSDDGHCTNPGTRRVASRRKMQDKWRRTKRWKDLVDKHAHQPDSECVYCHRHHGDPIIDRKTGEQKRTKRGKLKSVYLTINHTSRHLYASEELYLTWDPRYMEITCLSCNRQYESGMKPCPDCLKKGKLRYILDRDQECWSCYYEKHPEEKKIKDESRERFEKSVRDYNAGRAEKRRKEKVSHPCKFHRIGGWCGLSAIHSQCQYSKTKALKPAPVGCGDAIAKKKMVKK